MMTYQDWPSMDEANWYEMVHLFADQPNQQIYNTISKFYGIFRLFSYQINLFVLLNFAHFNQDRMTFVLNLFAF